MRALCIAAAYLHVHACDPARGCGIPSLRAGEVDRHPLLPVTSASADSTAFTGQRSSSLFIFSAYLYPLHRYLLA